MLEQSNTWVEEVLDRCSRYAPLGARGRLRSSEIGGTPKHTVMAGHVFIWSRYVQTDLKSSRISLLEMLS